MTVEEAPAFVKSSKRRNIQDEDNDILEPVMPAAPVLKMSKDRNKMMTSNKIQKKSKGEVEPREKVFPSYGKKFPYHKNSTKRKSNKKIFKKRLRLDTDIEEEKPALKEGELILDLFQNGQNDVSVDQLAQEAVENNSILKQG